MRKLWPILVWWAGMSTLAVLSVLGAATLLAAPRPNQTVSAPSSSGMAAQASHVACRALLHEAAKMQRGPGGVVYSLLQEMRGADGGVLLVAIEAASLWLPEMMRACDSKTDCHPAADSLCLVSKNGVAIEASLEITANQDGQPICTFACTSGAVGFIGCDPTTPPPPDTEDPPSPDPGPES
jgi:hypothetical protein